MNREIYIYIHISINNRNYNDSRKCIAVPNLLKTNLAYRNVGYTQLATVHNSSSKCVHKARVTTANTPFTWNSLIYCTSPHWLLLFEMSLLIKKGKQSESPYIKDYYAFTYEKYLKPREMNSAHAWSITIDKIWSHQTTNPIILLELFNLKATLFIQLLKFNQLFQCCKFNWLASKLINTSYLVYKRYIYVLVM